MKERPIKFSTPMVKAILDGRKTQTRRIVKHPTLVWHLNKIEAETPVRDHKEYFHRAITEGPFRSPYGIPEDILWVREAWESIGFDIDSSRIHVQFKVGFPLWFPFEADKLFAQRKGYPSIYMPKSIARIWLKIKDVRVERLHKISEDDAKAEGIDWHIDEDNREQFYCYPLKEAGKVRAAFGMGILDNSYISKGIFEIENPAQFSYRTLWDSINGFNSWKSNPWVWVVEFEVITTTGKELPF